MQLDMDSLKTSERLLRELKRVRQRKVKQLRSKISSGKYQVSNFEVAKSLFLAQ
ncbi:MAG: hypothetical protein DCC75_08015 [Proteobacteria bacterium]|nr:MAG: hypothetical protein DCC75_08015 [Pseudomonadota bacterium]